MPGVFRPDSIPDEALGARTNTFGEPAPKPAATSSDETYRGLPNSDADIQFEQAVKPPEEWIPGTDQQMERGGVLPQESREAERASFKSPVPEPAPVADGPADVGAARNEAASVAAERQRRSVRHADENVGQSPAEGDTPTGADETGNPYAQFAQDPPDNGVALTERLRLNRQEAYYRGSILGSSRLALMANLTRTPDPPDTDPGRKRANDGLRTEYKGIVADLAAYDLMKPWGSTLEAATALGGQLEGSLLSPESWVGWGARGTSFLWRTAKAGAQQAVIQGGADPIVQALDASAGVQDGYDPMRTVTAMGMGALIGGGAHAAGEGLGRAVGQGLLKRQVQDLSAEDPAFLGIVGQEPEASKVGPADQTGKPPEPVQEEPQAASANMPSAGDVQAAIRGYREAVQARETKLSVERIDAKPSERREMAASEQAAHDQLVQTLDGLGIERGQQGELLNLIERDLPADLRAGKDVAPLEARIKELETEFRQRVVPEEEGEGAPLMPAGDEAAMAKRRAGGTLKMEQRRATAGTPVGTTATTAAPTGTAVATVPQSPAQAVAVRSLQQQTMDLAKALDIPIREGRVQMRNALGVFNSRTGVVRVKEVPDFEVAAHEAGHAIEAKIGPQLTALMQAHASELAPLISNASAYAPSQHVKEGFAEWVRRYIGNPAHAQQTAPNFSFAFEQFTNANHPEILKALNNASDAYRAYLQAPSTDAVGAVRRSVDENLTSFGKLREQLREEGFPAVIKSFMQNAYSALVDDKAPVTRAVRDLARSIREQSGALVDLKDVDNPDVLFRMLSRSRQAAVRDMMDGVRPYQSVTAQGPSLANAITHAIGESSVWGKWDPEKKALFSHYLIARRAEYLWRKFEKGDLPNPPAAFSKADAITAMADFERANPNFRSASDMVHGYSREMLRKQFDAGLLDADTYGKLLKEEFYVPFMRDMSDKPLGEKGGTGGGGGSEGPGTVSLVKRMTGSARDIKDPIESLMAQTFMTNRTIRHNDVIKSFVNLARKAKGEGGRFVEPIPAMEAKRYTVDVSAILEKKATDAGMTPADAKAFAASAGNMVGEDPIIGSYFKMEQTSGKGEPIVFYREGGELKAARFMAEPEGHALYETLTAAPEPVTDMWMQLIGAAASLKRSGIITNPVFALTNYVRDQVSASLLRSDYVPFIGGVRGIADEFRQAQNAVLYGYAGGVAGGASVGPVEHAIKLDTDALAKKGYAVNRLTSFKGLLELASFTEAGTRNSVFANVYDAKIAQGLSPYEAMVEAAFQAQDLLDFSRHGSRTIAIRNLLPFLNAHIQGLDKARRTIIDPIVNRMKGDQVFQKEGADFRNALNVMLKAGALGGGLGAVWAAVMWEHESYRDASPYFKGTHLVVPFGNKMFVVPKPFELGLGFTAGEYAFARLMKDDARAGRQFMEAAWQTLQPPNPISDIPLISTATELALGKSLFTGKDIVPGQLQRLPSEMQFTDRTSGLAKWLGQMTGLSPMKIEYGIGSEFGNWGRDVMALSQGVDQDTPALAWDDAIFLRRLIKDPTRSSDITTKFWEYMAQTTGKFNQDVAAYDSLVKGYQDDRAQELMGKFPAAERAFVTLKSAAKEDGRPAFNADERRLHPLQRATDAVSLLNGLRRELSTNTFRDFETLQRLKLDPAKRRDIIENVRELAQMEMRNALVIMKEPGYESRPLLDTNDTMEKIVHLSPEIGAEIATRYATSRIYTTAAVQKAWPEVRDELVRSGSDADIHGIALDAKGDGYEFGGERVRRPVKRRVAVPAAH